MSAERRTKAELEAHIAELEDRVRITESTKATLARADAVLAAAPDDAEALAIARCVKALKAYAPSSSGYGTTHSGEVARILAYLSQRFGVS